MTPQFAMLIPTVHAAFERLIAMRPVTRDTLPDSTPSCGIYLFSEGDRHLYVGRSNGVRARLGRHCLPGANERKAAFAFRLAREATGNTEATYTTEGSRFALMQNPTFLAAFLAAKVRIRAMNVRFTEESDPIRQALLELYAAVTLGTPYNDFDTH